MILLVEDNAAHREAASVILQAAGYTVRSCATAIEGLEALLEAIPDVLILDILLPPLTGVSILSHMQDDPRCINVKVLITTALPDPAEHMPGLPALPQDITILQKPFTAEALLAAVQHIAPGEGPESNP